MKAQEQIERFWQKTESLLKKAQFKYRKILLSVSDEINLLIKGYKLDKEKLRKPLTISDKRALFRAIAEWQDKGIYTGFFKIAVEANKKRTYDDLLAIMIMYYYWTKLPSVKALTKNIARQTANDVRVQAIEESKMDLPKVTDKAINEAMDVPAYNATFDEYMNLKTAQDADKTTVKIRALMQAGSEPNIEFLQKIVEEICQGLLRVRISKEGRDIISGVIAQIIRQLANKIYVWLFVRKKEETEEEEEPPKEKPKEARLRFIAEMDDRTTPMCKSLHGQVFSATGVNEFTRYSASAGTTVQYRTIGMETGINLPPISDHFHWCRSRVIYIGEGED